MSKMLYQCAITKNPRLIYVAGVHSLLDNLGDRSLFNSYSKLFRDYSMIEYPIAGGRAVYYPVKWLRPTPVSILAGGTLINRISTKSTEDCLKLTGNLFVFGTGVAQKYFWNDRPNVIDYSDRWAEVLSKSKYVGVRGPLSKSRLEEMGVKNVQIVGDPVISYSLPKESLTLPWLPKNIGLNLGVSRGDVWGTETDICNEYIKLANILKTSGWRVQWFVVWPDDFEITKHAARESNTEEEIYCFYSDTLGYIEKVRKLHMFLGLKLHAVVLSTCAYVPSIMIEYRPKCLDYMLSIDNSDWLIRSDMMNAEEIWSMVENYKDQRKELSEQLYTKISNLKNIQQVELEKVKKMMSECV